MIKNKIKKRTNFLYDIIKCSHEENNTQHKQIWVLQNRQGYPRVMDYSYDHSIIFFHSFISTRNSKAMSFKETLTTSILFTSIMLSSYICYFHLEVGFKAKKSSFPMWWSISCFASNALVPWNRSTKIILSWVIWRTTKYQHPRGFF